MDWVELTDFQVRCVVGILQRERVNPQPLDVRLRMGMDFGPVSTGDLSLGVNYAEVADELLFIATEGRWRLIEAMGVAICEHLLLRPGRQRGPIESVELSLYKPEVLRGLATPGVSMARTKRPHPREWTSVAAGVRSTLLHEVPEVKLVRLTVQLGGALTIDPGWVYWLIGVGALTQVSVWRNETGQQASLLAIHADEAAVPLHRGVR